MKKIRVGIVNYLNTKPLVYGLERPPINDKIEVIGAYPARLVKMLEEDEVDIGLIPVGAIPSFSEWHIVGKHCIATEGEVASVCLFSEVPVEQVTDVYLDYQSRSSVELLKWLIQEHWGISPRLIQAEDESYREKISGSVAGLVIGDRAFEQRKTATFIYDLGSEWRAATGLPFVFAAWISKRKMNDEFVAAFDAANELGLQNIDEIVAQIHQPMFDMKKYYQLHLDYHLDDKKRKGLEMFLAYLNR